MRRIEKKFTIPKIIILDDEPKQVERTLKRIFENSGYNVIIVESQVEFKKYIKDHIAQFFLLDVQLSALENNIDGLKMAEECAEKYGEAIRICISRKNVLDISNEAIIKSINPIANRNYERYIEAYGNKHSPNEVYELVNHLRKKLISNDNVEILVDDALSRLIDDDFKFLNPKNDVPEPTHQFFELTKRLASKPYNAEMSEMHLHKIGSGRSRTIVCAMYVYMENDSVPYNSIIKIGSPKLISQEVDNYRRNVPKLINHGHYPILESFSTCREFSGLAYGKLGGFEEKMIPPTLRDKIIAKEIDIEKNAKQIIGDIFQCIIFKQRIEDPNPIKTLREEYSDRYHTLKIIPDLDIIIEQSLSKLEDFKLGFNNFPKNDLFTLSKFGNKKLRKFKDLLELNIGFSTYKQKICHGDLHFDNIIVDQNSVQYYFIDFAHTQEHHCFLDHIVLELGVRFQLMDEYLENSTNLLDLIEKLIKFEFALNNVVLNKVNNKSIEPNLNPFFKLICAIRHNAAIQFPNESSCNYFGGLGLTFASALRLPVKNTIKEKLRLWFSIISLLSLEIFEEFVEKTESLNLADYRIALSVTEEVNIINQLDLFKDSVIFEVKSMISTLIKANKFQDEVYIGIIEKQQTAINSLMTNLNNDYPLLKNEIENLNLMIQNQISDPQITGGVSFGLPFLMLQLNKKIKLPEKINKRINEIFE